MSKEEKFEEKIEIKKEEEKDEKSKRKQSFSGETSLLYKKLNTYSCSDLKVVNNINILVSRFKNSKYF